MPTSTKRLVYHSHISSHIQYGMLLWGNNATEDQLNRLQKIQNKCILTKTNIKSACKKLHILSIKDILRLANLKFGYKLAHNLLPTRITTICHEDSKKQTLLPKHHYNTRNRNVPNFPKASSKLYRDSFLYKGPRSILSIDAETQNLNTLQMFVNKCKLKLLQNYIE